MVDPKSFLRFKNQDNIFGKYLVRDQLKIYSVWSNEVPPFKGKILRDIKSKKNIIPCVLRFSISQDGRSLSFSAPRAVVETRGYKSVILDDGGIVGLGCLHTGPSTGKITLQTLGYSYGTCSRGTFFYARYGYCMGKWPGVYLHAMHHGSCGHSFMLVSS